MSYIGNAPISAAFLTDTFSGTGSQTAFTMTVAPANTSSILVSVTGVLQSPDTYSVSGTTLTFSAAPPSGTSNISVRYLGIPASGVTTTAYRTVTEFTATSGQTSFSVPSYTVGYIDVYRNGVMLGTADFTATTGTTVVLATGATTGDLIRTESFYVSSVLNAIPATAGSVSDSYIVSMAGSKLTGTQVVPKATLPTGSVLQVVNGTLTGATINTSSTSNVTFGATASITPTSASSKIFIIATGGWAFLTGSGLTEFCLGITRNGTTIPTGGNDGLMPIYGSTSIGGSYSMSILDTPATTSSTTYVVVAHNINSGGSVLWNGIRATQQNVITLMEIAA